MECWLSSFKFSRGSGPVLLKSPKGFPLSREGARTLCHPSLDPRILILVECADILFCQPRVEVTSCFVYKVMGLTFHDRINTPLICKIGIAEVVARSITEPQRTFSRFESHWLLFFYSLYLFIYLFFLEGGGGGRSDFINLFLSYCFLFLIIFYYFLSL